MIKVIIFPKDKNPYQSLLYSALDNSRIQTTYIPYSSNSFTLRLIENFEKILILRFSDFKIFHLHWLYSFQLPMNTSFARSSIFKLFFSFYFIFFILWIKLLGFKLIWTVHNVLPHEKIFINDKLLIKFLVFLSDSVIVHSRSTILEAREQGILLNNAKIIPMGYYPKTSDFKKNVKKQSFEFLFFGLIRPYKGVEELLTSFINISRKMDKISLTICGQVDDPVLKKDILSLAQQHKNIFTIFRFLSDEELGEKISNADAIVLPYKKVTTSSSAFLAFSYSKVVIAPKIGPFTEFPQNTGYFYNSDQTKGLEMAMIQAAIQKDGSKKAHAGLNYVKEFSWNKSAKQYLELCEDLLSS